MCALISKGRAHQKPPNIMNTELTIIEKNCGNGGYAMIDFLDKTWEYDEDIFDQDTYEEGWIEFCADRFLIGSESSHTIPEDIINILEENFIRYELSK